MVQSEQQSESINALWPQQGLLFDKNWFVAEKWKIQNLATLEYEV